MRSGTARATRTASRGEAIPIGARILAAVDCLDALASDRQYRRAMPLEDAMKVVRSEAGRAFDPRVVDALEQGYVEWERKAQLPAPKPAASFERREDRARAGAGGRLRSLQRIACGGSQRGRARELPESDCRGPAGSPGAIRNLAGPGKFAEPGRDSLGSGRSPAAHHSASFPSRVDGARRRADSGVCQRRRLPPLFFPPDSDGSGTLRMGGGKRQADRERKSFGGAFLPQ